MVGREGEGCLSTLPEFPDVPTWVQVVAVEPFQLAIYRKGESAALGMDVLNFVSPRRDSLAISCCPRLGLNRYGLVAACGTLVGKFAQLSSCEMQLS